MKKSNFLYFLFNFRNGRNKVIYWLIATTIFSLVAEPEDFDDLRLYFGRYSRGPIQLIEETDLNVNDEDVLHYFYSFSLGDELYEGNSYGNIYKEEGEEVRIAYLKNNPNINRIFGTSLTKGGLKFTFLALIPFLFTSVIFLVNLVKVLKMRNIVKNGILTEATLANTERTGWQRGSAFLNSHLYIFEADFNKYKTFALIPENKEARETEKIIYLPKNPNRNLMPATLSDKLQYFIYHNAKF